MLGHPPRPDRAKRTFDVGASLLALTILWPVLLAVAIAVRVRLGSPVLFRQLRPGLGGHPFVIYKFRTMRAAVDRDGRPLPDRERATAFGTRLRNWSLDELPELVNVLRGDMSIVGPRPLLLEYLPHYSPEQMRRHEVLPGITGWAQVHGRDAVDWPARFALDIWYVDHRSMALDLRIIALTIVKTLRQEGVTPPGRGRVHTFRGSGDGGNCTAR